MSSRDRKNKQALEKLANAGAKIKTNNRLHARFLVAHIPENTKVTIGLLVIGSFDFNTECIGKERYDGGILTRHPDLVKSAVKTFNNIWSEKYSTYLFQSSSTTTLSNMKVTSSVSIRESHPIIRASPQVSSQEVIRRLLSTTWGRRQPRYPSEVLNALMSSGFQFTDGSVTKDLINLTNSGVLRRILSEKGYGYVLAK